MARDHIASPGVDGSREIDLERFDAYYAGGPKGRPPIRYVKITEVLGSSGELTALVSGETDWIWQYDADQFQSLAQLPGKTALRAGSMRIVYLQMDAAGRTGHDHPLTDQKVRQATCHAIDCTAIAKDLVQADSHPIDAPCYPGQFGCEASAATRYKYDPAKARQLLAEAGSAKGFATTLVSYLLPAWGAAVQNYLKAVGINANIQQLQVGAGVRKVMAGRAPSNVGSWGSHSINDVAAILPPFFGGGPFDYARDPAIETLVAAGGSVTDPRRRLEKYAAAVQRITDEAYWLPMFTSVTYYAFSRNLDVTPFPDELPRFYLCRWT